MEKKNSEDLLLQPFRSFVCRKCGKRIQVLDAKDRRCRFCSKRCEKLYWKYPEKNEAVFYRLFYGQYCGEKVVTKDIQDCRRRYCCKTCRLANN